MERDRRDPLEPDAAAPAPSERPAAGRIARWEWATHDEMADAIGDARMRAFIHSVQSRPWGLEAFCAGSALVQRGVEGAAVSGTGCLAPGRIAFFLTGERSASRRCNGEEIDSGGVYRWVPEEEFTCLSRRPTEWLALTATADGFLRAARVVEGGAAAERTLDARASKAGPAPVAAFRRLLEGAMGAMDEAGPAGLHPEAARNLEETLSLAAARLFAHNGDATRRSRRRADRGRILAEVEAFLAAAGSEPVYISALCEKLGLPERTLRFVFEEQFGASPMRVLRARRLCDARRALRAAPEGTRVSDVAGRFGFWHLGQFAADYRSFFREKPSETLLAARAGNRPKSVPDSRGLQGWAATAERLG
ncbi:MAG: hypothetical protein DIJKHBIC_00372 [Thermoanaerobaculia bacterium]|nr:hypothetical protein [Thermoanaerobaculia bacterium]